MKSRPEGQVTTAEAVEALGINRRTFQDWKLKPSGKLGNANLYSLRDLIEADRARRAADAPLMDDDQRRRLAEARIRLTEAKAIEQERRNAMEEHQIAPFSFFTYVLGSLANAIGAHIDSIPTVLIRQAGISVKDAERVKASSVGVANQIATLANEQWVTERFQEFLEQEMSA